MFFQIREEIVTVKSSDDDGHLCDCEKSNNDYVTKEVDCGEHKGSIETILVSVILKPTEAINNTTVAFSSLGAILLEETFRQLKLSE
jgi:hypothetical protein